VSLVHPAAPRHTVEASADALRFDIPSRKRWAPILFQVVWFVFSLVIGLGGATPFVTVLWFMASNERGIPILLLLAGCLVPWLAGLLVLGGWGALTFFWQLIGHEIVEVNQDEISIRHAVSRLSRTRRFSAKQIDNLEVCPLPQPRFFGGAGPRPFWSLSYGPIRLKQGPNTIYFAGEVDEAEAKQILAAIQQRFPQYRHPEASP
jgi:hypothetical protein